MAVEIEFEFVKKSGNNFHYEVYKYFKGMGWEVLVSPYYLDGVTDKPREIDLVVQKSRESRRLDNQLSMTTIRLFIECKYINDPTVFWFDRKDNDKTLRSLDERMAMEKKQFIH